MTVRIRGLTLRKQMRSDQPDTDLDDLRRSVDDGSIDLPVRLTLSGGLVTRIDEAGLLAG